MEIIKKSEWEESYKNRDNHVWYPHEEIIRFVARYFVKRTGVDEFQFKGENNLKALDFGCGLGRHVIFLDEHNIEAYGIDISETAIISAKKWANAIGKRHLEDRYINVDGDKLLPFSDNSFDFVVSHGVFDSMFFDLAKINIKNIERIVKTNGLVYLDVVSGDDNVHAREYSGEEIVETSHEFGTVQSYFNYSKIEKLIEDTNFVIEELKLIRQENVFTGAINSRYHIVLIKINDN